MPVDPSLYLETFSEEVVENDTFYELVEARLRDPNKIGDLGYTLLHRASWSREPNPRIVNLLLEKGANVNSSTVYGHTPLHFAVSSRKRYAVAALIKAGAHVNSFDYFRRTALHFSIDSDWTFVPIPDLDLPCDMWIVTRLLSHPEIDINPKDCEGSTPIMWATKKRNLLAVKALLKKSANPNIPDINGQIPLHLAMYHSSSNTSFVYCLLQNGSDIYCVDNHGNTPIDMLVRNVKNHGALLFAKNVVWLIALLYRIEDSLKSKLKQIPELSEYFEKCYEEVIIMNRLVVYDKFTLHDVALNCYQTRCFDDNEDISMFVMKLLLSRSFVNYIHLIHWRI